PNPASDIITIKGIENINFIKVYSISGTLEKQVFNTNQIDISELSSGVYLIQIDNGIKFTKKVIKL
ncbi:T9SS type A sorting domain-containing protein, partial [Flavobacteriaceae bacterium]|nr:T9SS type A sorting domain-containing protein [Flavobacteriaceae bacterium]MDA9803451.1 T9SS type A sorting domain-containing protein [Flavobacteriaceae bacterium]